ncbi:NAD(P)H-binding protein [Flavobacterium sp. MC2016-06]|jgi:putative NADH-flavin reductase|uniref:NAD(P)-dependent oxidoreductase n=1 Tax=Flavobacterium sp. MC2016-06 TaxID=2676308 RepID=UPI0012BA5699|nr:NAD(P)H-binding protein [Flavobacterium sp. MC2016-06]MBU3860340.1 NAD(P)H-binding protein [Flavobacterium sp. MC2016-06]
MNITIIGASAGVGLETVKRALDRNHIVTTLSRSEINLPSNKNLKILKGSATNKSDLKIAIENADAVIVALGTGTSFKATTLFSESARLLSELQIETNNTVPFIVLTGFGAGESRQYLSSLLQKIFFKLFLDKEVYKDKNKMEEIISNSKMNWEIVRAGTLENKPLTEKYKVETTLYKGIKIGEINRADVADFMVKQAENPTELKKYVSISNK